LSESEEAGSAGMTFEELLGQVKILKCKETRAQEKDYLEVVVTQDQLGPIVSVLEACFGPPLKPRGQRPSGDANRYAGPHGGVRANQTLYHRKHESSSEMALLWPWGSGDTVTVKIIRE
jgi:hypothetical protein